MTEAEWLASITPSHMLEWLREIASARKLRLFTVASARGFWRPLTDARSHALLELAERHAEGNATQAEFNEAARLGYCPGLIHTIEPTAYRAALLWVNNWELGDQRGAEEAKLLREIFGNPFQPAPTNSAWESWNDGVVLKIAQSIYDARRFADLPILADALEDAGCDDRQILDHCRGGSEHVRGCWVVDLLLGKK
jgi:hypothetical protein